MAVRFTDEEIEELIGEEKFLPKDYRARSQLRAKKGHYRRELENYGREGKRL